MAALWIAGESVWPKGDPITASRFPMSGLLSKLQATELHEALKILQVTGICVFIKECAHFHELHLGGESQQAGQVASIHRAASHQLEPDLPSQRDNWKALVITVGLRFGDDLRPPRLAPE